MKDKNKDKDKKADNSKSKNQKFELIVVEALQDDAYKGIARIDSEVMRELGIKRGDVILIKGNRKIVVIVDSFYPEDMGEEKKSLIRNSNSFTIPLNKNNITTLNA